MAHAAASNLKRRILGSRLESNSNTNINSSNVLNNTSTSGTSNGNLINGVTPLSSSSFSLTTSLLRHSQLSIPVEHRRLRVDRRCIDKVWKQMDRIVKYCQCPKLNLKNSPPYMLDILPDIYQTLKQILLNYDGRLDILNDIDYFPIFMENLIDKCSKTTDCFKRAGNSIYDEQSSYRKHLTILSLYFSHILTELKSLFPKGICESEKFRITKPEAAEFWKNNFIQCGNESIALQNTIDLTNNNYVSIFEFDVFTRLFHPWSSLLTNWKLLAVTHPAFMAFMTYDEMKAILMNFIDKPGSYLFRLSCTRLGQWAIGYVTSNGTILQTIPQIKPLLQSLIDGEREGYYKYPNGLTVTIDLSSAFRSSDYDRIYVSEEQYAIYCDMETSFELCKICNVNNKDSKIQPCGHLLCKECLQAWQNSMSKMNLTCPFCRAEIKGFEQVIISPFENNQKKSTENTTNDSNDFDDSSDLSGSLSLAPPPVPPRPVQKLERKENESDRRQRVRRNHTQPLLNSTYNHTNNETRQHSQNQNLIVGRPSPFKSSSESLNESSESTNYFRTTADVSRRLAEKDHFDPVRIQAALTLTGGLDLTKQYEMAKEFLNQVQQQHTPTINHNTFVNELFEQE
ncbi:unnamed protein product [Didymodactylos carnosus]|uniref:E3 ubiquitin-protein ligase CBL n=1 Tax=Didymodactylos carnosus TaxID=1234261 RepID=A0A814RVU6_9BILA|nr:unnamed protein product [Didymodactylos carnosus]CAF1138071.1 unnamed protein product [Didymodactylos carnosus]CAF3696786.1 unnamed protein product [Didymodactylos carnosus]CAF3901832.1 unnamed protein product [Didymodactylos carnosus]